MTEYEINKRLAEIAGVKAWDRRMFGVLRLYIDVDPENSDEVEEWSPLTDWGQLGPLMERYVYRVERGYPGEDSCYAGAVSFPEPGEWVFQRGPDCSDLKRAIALAIIAAHGEGTT